MLHPQNIITILKKGSVDTTKSLKLAHHSGALSQHSMDIICVYATGVMLHGIFRLPQAAQMMSNFHAHLSPDWHVWVRIEEPGP